MNAALLGTWIWRLFKQPDLLWCQLVNHMYYRNSCILQGKVQRMSRFWKDICNFLDIFICSTMVKLGNGKLCDFWCSDISLASLFPQLYKLTESKIIVARRAGFWKANRQNWTLNFRRNLVGRQIDEYRRLIL